MPAHPPVPSPRVSRCCSLNRRWTRVARRHRAESTLAQHLRLDSSRRRRTAARSSPLQTLYPSWQVVSLPCQVKAVVAARHTSTCSCDSLADAQQLCVALAVAKLDQRTILRFQLLCRNTCVRHDGLMSTRWSVRNPLNVIPMHHTRLAKMGKRLCGHMGNY